jgi:hypothetical protein
MRAIPIIGAALIAVGLSLPARADVDWSKVAEALGKAGTATPSGVYRVGLPRTDLHVMLDGVELKPTLALGSWLAFKSMGDSAMVMGDLVLTEAEVNPVMLKLTESGIEITALHNHLLRASPATMYMHILGHGDPVKLAATLHDALGASKTPFQSAPAASAAAPPIDLDTAAIDRTLGYKGKVNGGVYQVSVPRAAPVSDDDMVVPDAMGSAEAINFQPTGGGKAAITGDFLVTAEEVNPLIKTLRANGIEVTAIHSHMLDEQPRMIFIHFWANDDAEKLARRLRAALDKTAAGKS